MADKRTIYALEKVTEALSIVTAVLNNRMDGDFIQTNLGERLSGWFEEHCYTEDIGKNELERLDGVERNGI